MAFENVNKPNDLKSHAVKPDLQRVKSLKRAQSNINQAPESDRRKKPPKTLIRTNIETENSNNKAITSRAKKSDNKVKERVKSSVRSSLSSKL